MKNPILAENNWKTIRETKVDLVVLPWGANEAHNLHLPYGTDNYQVEAITTASAKIVNKKGFNVAVLPTIPYGVNTGQSDIQLTLNLNPSTQMIILKDFAESLNRQGIFKLLVMNGHGGNDFKQIIREVNYLFPKMFITSCNWFHAFESKQFFVDDGEHAGETETSLMMYLKPELILPLKDAGDGANRKFKVDALNEKWAWAERQWTQVTKDTGIGNPQLASAEKGEALFKLLIQKISTFMQDLSELDITQPYK